jgi:hypothetical protein
METPFDQLERSLHDDLLGLHQVAPLERYHLALERIDRAIKDLKTLLTSHEFEDEREEIAIFKGIRPRLVAYRIEEALRYNATLNQPIGTPEVLSSYYNEILKGLQSFFQLHSFYYQYYKNHFQELDHLYFVRRASPVTLPVPEVTEKDTPYSTPMSDLFARFIAYERVQQFILTQMAALQSGRADGMEVRPGSELQWTGDTLSAVEIIYGLWLTGQLNHGNASLNQIVRWFEVHLQVSIGLVQRRFAKIQGRKRLSVTRFLDQMRDAISRKIDDDQS